MDKNHLERAGYFDKGVLSKKGVYFHSPSTFARQNLFCILWGAEYMCDTPYEIHRRTERQFMDVYMIQRIIEGELHFEYRNTSFAARAGDIVFLDSHIPNHYWADSPVRWQFFHFNGPLAKPYCDLLFQQQGACHPGRSESGFLFNNILREMSQTTPNDHRLSLWMYNLISGLVLPQNNAISTVTSRAQHYMEDNFQKSLLVEEIASYAMLSRYHFSRLFKQETGFSPHQYLINIRLRHARELLSQGSVPMDVIASTCGFSSTSHFISVFKKENGMTPVMFQKMSSSLENPHLTI